VGDRPQRAAHPVRLGRRERVGKPAGRVVHKDVDRSQPLFRQVEQDPRRARVGQVGLRGDCTTAEGLDLSDNGVRSASAVVSVGLRYGWIDIVAHPPERAHHRAALPGERYSRCRADAVIRAGHDRRVRSGFVRDGSVARQATTPSEDEPSGIRRTSRRSEILSFRSVTWLTMPIARP